MTFSTHLPLRFKRYVGSTGSQALPSDCSAVVGICVVAGTSATLQYDGDGSGTDNSVVGKVTTALIANLYFPSPVPISAKNASTARVLEVTNGSALDDYTIIYIPTRSSEF